MKRSIAKAIGLTFLTLFLVCGIVAIILAGLDFQFANPGWRNNLPWEALSALQIASIAYAIFVALVGFFVFCFPKRALIIFFGVLLALSILFTLAIAIFSIIAGSTGFLNVNFGCNARINGLLNTWNNMDTYLQNVDRTLCSSQCPCSIANQTFYSTNNTVAPFFNNYVRNVDNNGIVNYQGCPSNVQSNVLNLTRAQNPNFDPDQNNFNEGNFINYMARVENEFQCTGWCTNAYVNNGQNVIMYKYLFTNLNRGPALYSGCLNSVLQWLPGYLLAFGAVAMVLAGFQMIVLATLCCLGASRREEVVEHQVYEEPAERHVKVVERVPVVQNVPVVREMPVVRDVPVRS